MHVAELWRYPVKSMAGELLDEVELTREGLAGDRVVQVRDGRGRTITARTHPGLLKLRGAWDVDRQASLIDGQAWDSSGALRAVREVVGEDARLVADDSRERFDVLPLLVATDGAIGALGVDRRRLRPNVVVAGVDGLAEREWPGRRLRIGTAVIAVESVRARCVMTTYDPDTQAQDLEVLRRIVKRFGGRMALDCDVVLPGRIRTGDRVELV